MLSDSSAHLLPEQNKDLTSLSESLKDILISNRETQQYGDLPINTDLGSLRRVESNLLTSLTVLRSFLNTASPILRIPPEVLVQILELGLPPSPFAKLSPPSGPQIPSILRLSHVSRGFRHTALSFPHLWAHIVFDHRTADLQELFFSRSGHADLFLYVYRLKGPQHALLENIMINNASRIQELFLGVGLPSSTISLFVSPFTRLQKFLCFGSMSHSALANHNSWFNVISGRTPVLSHLGLSRFTSWPSQNQLSRLRFLRTLHFSGTQKHNFEITLVDILTTLTALSHLVELRFATPAFTIRSPDVTPNDDVHYVELPYLNSLEFIECLRSTSHVLLSHFMLHHGVKILILNPQSPTLGQPAHISSISELVPSSFLLSLRTNQIDIRESNHILPFTSGRTTENSTLWYPEAKSTTSSGMEILLVSTISHMKIGIRITGLSFRDRLLSNLDSVVSPKDIEKLHLDLNSGWFICLPAAFPSQNSYILSTREDQDYNPLSWLKDLSNLEELSISPTEFGRNAHDVMSNSFGRKICCEFSPLLVENVAFSIKEPQRKQARSPHLRRFSILCQGIYGTARWLKDFEEIFKAREKAGARELELVTVVYPVVMGVGVENELLEGMEMTRMEMRKVGRMGLDSVVDW